MLFLGVLGFSLAAPLGPVNIEMMKKTLSNKKGWLLGIITGFGATSADFIIAMSVLFIGSEGLSFILKNSTVKVILFVFNALILVYIGIGALKTGAPKNENNNVDRDIDNVNNEVEKSGKDKVINTNIKINNAIIKQYTIGFAIVTTSPWSYLWWASFGPYILGSGVPLSTLEDRFAVTIFFIAGILTWVLLFNIALSISHRFASPKILNIISRFSAILILYFALKILYDAIIIIINS